MSYTNQPIDQRLQRERAQRIEREFKAYDAPNDGEFDKAIDRMIAEERARMDNGVLAGSSQTSQKIKGIAI